MNKNLPDEEDFDKNILESKQLLSRGKVSDANELLSKLYQESKSVEGGLSRKRTCELYYLYGCSLLDSYLNPIIEAHSKSGEDDNVDHDGNDLEDDFERDGCNEEVPKLEEQSEDVSNNQLLEDIESFLQTDEKTATGQKGINSFIDGCSDSGGESDCEKLFDSLNKNKNEDAAAGELEIDGDSSIPNNSAFDDEANSAGDSPLFDSSDQLLLKSSHLFSDICSLLEPLVSISNTGTQGHSHTVQNLELNVSKNDCLSNTTSSKLPDGNIDESITDFENKVLANSFAKLGECLMHLGEFDAADVEFEKSLELFSTMTHFNQRLAAEAFFNAGLNCLNTNNSQKAKMYFQNCLKQLAAKISELEKSKLSEEGIRMAEAIDAEIADLKSLAKSVETKIENVSWMKCEHSSNESKATDDEISNENTEDCSTNHVQVESTNHSQATSLVNDHYVSVAKKPKLE